MHFKFLRMISLTILVVMTVVVAIPVNSIQAQGYCALEQEDCDLFEAAMQEQDNVKSFNVETMNITMVGEADGQALGIDVINMAGPIAYYRNQLDFDAAWTLETVTVQVPDSTGSVSLTGMEIRVVDGSLYFYNPIDGVWETDSLELGELNGILNNSPMSMTDNEFLLSPTNEMWSEDLATWSTETTDLNGTEVVKFTADVKLGDIVSNQDFMLVVGEALEAASDGEITAELFQIIMGGVALQIKDELNAGTFQVSYYISPADNLVYGFDMLVNTTLDLGFLSGLVNDINVEAISLNLDIEAVMSGQNETYEITPPALD